MFSMMNEVEVDSRPLKRTPVSSTEIDEIVVSFTTHTDTQTHRHRYTHTTPIIASKTQNK